MICICLKQQGLTKKIVIFSIIAAVCIATVAIILFYFKKSDNGVLSKVPINSKSVIVIDLSSLSKKLFIDDLGKENKSRTNLLKNLPDSLADIDFKNSGLSLSDKAVLFTLEDTSAISINFILKIENSTAFNNFIKELGQKLDFAINNSDGAGDAYIPVFGILLAWNKEYVVGTRTDTLFEQRKIFLKNMLVSDKGQSILADASFLSKLKNSFDVFFYTKPYKICPIKELELFNSDIESFASLISFNDGNIEIESEAYARPGSLIEKLCTGNEPKFVSVLNTDTCMADIKMNVDPQAFRQILNIYSSKLFKEGSIPFLKSWNGKADITLNGIKSIENEFITYDYDDDFNKIEIKQVKKNKIPDIIAIADINQSIFDSIAKLNKPIKEGTDTLLFAGSNYILKKANDKLLIYSKQTKLPFLDKISLNNNLSIKLNYQRFMGLLDEFGVKFTENWLNEIQLSKLEITVNKSEMININSKFFFVNKDKNAFYSLFDNI
jgi:hypothetical protein